MLFGVTYFVYQIMSIVSLAVRSAFHYAAARAAIWSPTCRPIMKDRFRVCVFGAGAIGGLSWRSAGQGRYRCKPGRTGGAARGDSATRPPSADRDEEHVAVLPCTDRPGDLGVQEFVIVALKAHQICRRRGRHASAARADTAIVTASNGLALLVFPRLRRATPIGRHRSQVSIQAAVSATLLGVRARTRLRRFSCRGSRSRPASSATSTVTSCQSASPAVDAS